VSAEERRAKEERLQVEIEGEELAEAKLKPKIQVLPVEILTPELNAATEPVVKKIAYLAFLHGTHPDFQKHGSEAKVEERRRLSFEAWWRAYTRGL
jgi:hypothetical protein